MTSYYSTVGLLSAAPSGLILSVDGRNYSNSSVISDSITGISWNMSGASYNATRKSIVLTSGKILYNNGGSGPDTFNPTVNTQIVIYYRLGNSTWNFNTLFTIGRSTTIADLESVFSENFYWDYQAAYGMNFNATTSLTGTTGWYMRAFVKNGASGTIYLNGSRDGSSTGALNVSLGNKLFCVGADHRDGEYLNGEIAWVGLWNVALTAAQIQSIYYNWYYAGNIPADSYTIIPTPIIYPATGTATVQYNSVLFQTGASYTLKNVANTTLTTASYSSNPISFTFSASSLGPGSNTLQIYNASGNVFGIPIIFNVACFREGTLIRCLDASLKREVYIPVEHITRDTFVSTFASGYKRVEAIGYSTIFNPNADAVIDNRLFCYKAGPEMPALFEDLYITGNHSVLVEEEFLKDDLKTRVESHMGDIYKTEGFCRLPACLDKRAEPFVEPGTYKIWHFALENDDIYANYGVYANGLLVESSSIRYMTELSKMTLV